MRIGTRKSTMALAQTREVIAALRGAWPAVEVEMHTSRPQGDRDLVSRLDRHGGKGGAFVAELRAAMLEGRVQAAMHSLKDMPGNEEVRDLVIGAYRPRDDPRDALVLRPGVTLERLRTSGGTIGTNSVRRAAQCRRLFARARIVHFRGAADTRVDKLDRGEGQLLPEGGRAEPADALVLAASGLRRVGLESRIAHLFEPDEMLPAIGQGIVAVECADRDWPTRERLAAIDDGDARTAALAEREVLWLLEGHCNAPIAGLATRHGASLRLRAAVYSPDGAATAQSEREGPAHLPRELGRAVAQDLLAQGAADLLARSRELPQPV